MVETYEIVVALGVLGWMFLLIISARLRKMELETEYKKEPCYYCGEKKLRTKLHKDWTLSDIHGKGKYEFARYYYCDACKKTCMTHKEAILT